MHECGKEEAEKILSEIGPQEPRGVSAGYMQMKLIDLPVLFRVTEGILTSYF
jgi:hypothetical protein